MCATPAVAAPSTTRPRTPTRHQQRARQVDIAPQGRAAPCVSTGLSAGPKPYPRRPSRPKRDPRHQGNLPAHRLQVARSNSASASTDSSIAKCRPRQARGPPLKGNRRSGAGQSRARGEAFGVETLGVVPQVRVAVDDQRRDQNVGPGQSGCAVRPRTAGRRPGAARHRHRTSHLNDAGTARRGTRTGPGADGSSTRRTTGPQRRTSRY